MVVSDPLRPNGTVLMEWVDGTGHGDINNEVTDPDEDITTFIRATTAAGDDNDVCIVSFPDTIDDVDEVTNIQVKTFGAKATDNPEVSVNMGGWSAEPECVLGEVPSTIWATNNFGGSWSQADLDGLQVRYRADIEEKNGLNVIFICYVIVTYTATAPTGYGHDFLGIPAANIDSIMGIPAANIDNICGL